MKKIVNRYWVINLWQALDGEFIEINNIVDRYLNLDIANENHRKIIIRELLIPCLECFTEEDKVKIKESLFFAANNLSEEELLKLLNFFGGTVFNSPSPNINIKDLYIKIGIELFNDLSFSKHSQYSEYYDLNDLESFRLKIIL